MFLAAALCARELWNYHLLKRRKDDTVGMHRSRLLLRGRMYIRY